jgi:hypothetical protein
MALRPGLVSNRSLAGARSWLYFSKEGVAFMFRLVPSCGYFAPLFASLRTLAKPTELRRSVGEIVKTGTSTDDLT